MIPSLTVTGSTPILVGSDSSSVSIGESSVDGAWYIIRVNADGLRAWAAAISAFGGEGGSETSGISDICVEEFEVRWVSSSPSRASTFG